MKLFLIGLPGCGKSTLGKKVAEKYKLSFLDLDEEIEAIEGLTIPQIFTKYGENYFRKKETETLLKIINENPAFVLSTGGGTPCFFSNLKIMKEAGTVIFINTPFDVITERLSVQKESRPLIKDTTNILDKVVELFSQRSQYYQQAHFTSNNEDELFEVVNIISNQ